MILLQVIRGLELFQLYFVDMVRRIGVVGQMTRTNKSEDNGEKHEAVEKTEHHDQEEHFEEDYEGVVVRGGQEHDCQ